MRACGCLSDQPYISPAAVHADRKWFLQSQAKFWKEYRSVIARWCLLCLQARSSATVTKPELSRPAPYPPLHFKLPSDALEHSTWGLAEIADCSSIHNIFNGVTTPAHYFLDAPEIHDVYVMRLSPIESQES